MGKYVWEDKRLEISSTAGECQLGLPLWNTVWQFSKKLSNIMAMWPSDYRPIPAGNKYRYLHIGIYMLVTIVIKEQKQHIYH